MTQNEFDNEYFCVLPFYGYEFTTPSPGGTHCCLLPKGHDIEEVRQDILDKKRSKWCASCWKLEDAGLISDRLLKNSAMDFYIDKDIRFIEQDVRDGKYSLQLLKVRSSNLCNAACVTCGTGSSTLWASFERQAGISDVKYASVSRNVIDSIEYSKLVSLSLLAGEPMYEKLTFVMLQKLANSNNFDCFIQITTNGSIAPDGERRELLQKFNNLNFNVSIDGIGKVFEYMRYPLKWEDIKNNINNLRELTNNVSVSYTTSNINVLYHHDTVNWFKDNNLNYHFNPVIFPAYFRPGALLSAVKQIIFDKFGRTDDLNFFIGNHTEQDDKDFTRMLAVIKQQDSMKNISIKDYLPEFYNLIQDH